MSKRYKINWKGIAGEIIGWSVIGSFLGGDYQFDFANEMITVDGPDEADRVFQFGEYESHDMIARVRENGCQIALQIPSALEDFQSTNSIQYPEFDEAMKISTSFSNRFCEQSL